MSDPTDTPIDRVPLSPPRVAATGDIPGLPPLPALPKPSAPALPAPPKPAPAEKIPDPAPVEAAAPGVPRPPQPRWVREAVLDLVRPNRQKGLVLAAAASLVAGATAMNAIFSVPDRATEPTAKAVATRPTPEPESTATVPAPTPEPAATAQEPAPAAVVAAPPIPSFIATLPDALPPIPTPGLPGTGKPEPVVTPAIIPAAVIPAVVNDRPPPIVVAEAAAPVVSAVIPGVAAPASPPTTGALPVVLPPVIPTSGAEPAAPTTPATPPVAPLPAPALPVPVPQQPASGTPALTVPDLTKPDTTKPGTPAALPPATIPGLPTPAALPAAPEKPKADGGITGLVPSAPMSALPTPNLTPLPRGDNSPARRRDVNAVVVTPDGVEPAQQPTTDTPTPAVLPRVPAAAPPAVQTPAESGPTAATGAIPPAQLPVTPGPMAGASQELPPTPAPAPAAAPRLEPAPVPTADTVSLTKPPGATDVRPNSPAPAEKPQTDFDVDLYPPKAGDTYESISQRHYGDARYAGALRAFNRGLDIGRGTPVQVPPMYVLRQRYGQHVGAPPASAAEPARGVIWEPTGDRRGGGIDRASYAVPRDGMTLWDVAEDVYRDRQEWKRVWDANPRLDPNARLAAGTRLALPSDARASR